ncbi:hypothetical protein HanXRQr2_Chr12g0537981 [Helianthus annuus]|nr:hypothetical protein HanXRQr2_Chr12g0537981 [Helianthus annuus]KAJ0489146.1 hypothetical protein HanHA300_Chr12g0440661 [Helianthus annuus]KAJ0505024.1 hypothetical protein HanHA89_Chr12g0465781 [Helianthus annuus]KAJ0674708.1 hypothetical protein HanLR1_Chr12g0442901 [Helianthus annuus]
MNNINMVDHQAEDRYNMYEFDSVELICYFERLLVILHEKELTWVGRLLHKHHTCVISALRVSTSLKQHPLIWSATAISTVPVASIN